MKRRTFLKGACALPLVALARAPITNEPDYHVKPFSRVRPGDRAWPSPDAWESLRKSLQGDLIKLQSPFANCKDAAACHQLFSNLQNPYHNGDDPALTQTSGWLNAWTSSPSEYAVAAKSTHDVVAAVNFARVNKLRLVIKGGGHSYQGTSNSKDSLLIWTRRLNAIELHDRFIPQGGEGKIEPQQAVTLGSGVIWMQAYDAVTTKAGRYVQGGGCTTVGVAGLIQSGGFGSFSKNYGLAAAGLLEAEVVTADGKPLTVNNHQHADLYWALKGGGGGTMGVVTKITLRTRELPEFFGVVSGEIKANSDEAHRDLIEQLFSLYHDKLFDAHWGEQIRFHTGRRTTLSMVFCDLTKEEAEDRWKPLIQWIESRAGDYTWTTPFFVAALPARHLWDAAFFDEHAPTLIKRDNRTGVPSNNFYWAGDGEESGQFLHGYHSRWLSKQLLESKSRQQLVRAVFDASSQWTVSFHFNKGLAGCRPAEIEAARDTAINPAVMDAFALVIIAGNARASFPGVAGHEPNIEEASRRKQKIDLAFAQIDRLSAIPSSYVSESSFFENNWQQSFWGANYRRLSAIKQKYDPEGLFFVHHGVGSETWSADGFTRR